MTARFAFEGFVLDTRERRLIAGEEPVELNARYLDALALLVRDCGKLVPKDQFLDEVWRGVPVTDEALTQCIKTLRRKLGDDAASPRFIETVPKHGYRFIAPVRLVDTPGAQVPSSSDPDRRAGAVATGLAGTLGGIAAGVIGGLIYGFLGALDHARHSLHHGHRRHHGRRGSKLSHRCRSTRGAEARLLAGGRRGWRRP